jgi:hypothetical protein
VCALAGTATVTATAGFLYYKKIHIPRYVNHELFDHLDNNIAPHLKRLRKDGYIIDDGIYIRALKRDPKSLVYFPPHLLTLENILLAVNNVEKGFSRMSILNSIIRKIPEELFIQNDNLARKLVSVEPHSIKSIPSIFLTEGIIVEALRRDDTLFDYVSFFHSCVPLPEKLILRNKYNILFRDYMKEYDSSNLPEETRRENFITAILETIPDEYLSEKMFNSMPRYCAFGIKYEIERLGPWDKRNSYLG